MGVGGGLEVGGLLVCLRKLKPWIGSLFGRRGRGGGVKAWQFNGFSLCLSFFFFFLFFIWWLFVEVGNGVYVCSIYESS